jgi:HrpA-like RNA helicase
MDKCVDEGPTLLRKGFLEEVCDTHDSSILYSPTKDVLDQSVPVDYIMNRISSKKGMSESPMDRIFLLNSSTGSGKSTILPPEFYHRYFNDLGGKNICCTQPRVLTSIDIPNTILKYHTKEALQKSGHGSRTPLIMGKNIGYQTGVVSKKPVRGLIYMTIQVLTQQLNIMSDEDFMARYSAIFIDEVHERSVPTDYALYALKKFINRNCKNRNCPFLFIMSATFDTWKFADYLLSECPKSKRYENIIIIKGFTHHVDHNYLSYDSTNYIQSAIDTATKIHKENPEDFGAVKEGGGKRRKKFMLSEDTSKGKKYRDILIFPKISYTTSGIDW